MLGTKFKEGDLFKPEGEVHEVRGLSPRPQIQMSFIACNRPVQIETNGNATKTTNIYLGPDVLLEIEVGREIMMITFNACSL